MIFVSNKMSVAETAPTDGDQFDMRSTAEEKQEEEEEEPREDAFSSNVHPNILSTVRPSPDDARCVEHPNVKEEEWESASPEQHWAHCTQAQRPVEDETGTFEFDWRQTAGNIKEEPSSCSVDELIKREKPEEVLQREERDTDSSDTDVSDDWPDADADLSSCQQQTKMCGRGKTTAVGQNAVSKKFPTEKSFPKNPTEESEGPPSKKSETSKRGKHYNCAVCSKYFSNITYLKSHMRSHTGEKPFGCYVCGQSFTYGSNLNRHMSVHAFRCNICRKRSLTNLSLRVDTGKKAVSCDVCRKKFKQSVESRKHFRVQEFLKNIFTEISDEDEVLE